VGPEEQLPAKPRRRRRGGRGRRRKSADNGAAQTAGRSPASADAANAPVPGPVPPLVPTGSTDRHLIEDEPVIPQPVRRPRSVRDLDNIPEDYD